MEPQVDTPPNVMARQNQNTSAPHNLPFEKKKISYTGVIVVVVVLVLVGLLVAGYFFLARNNTSTQTVSNSGGIPPPKTTDLAPGVPSNQKTAIVIEHSDSSLEKIILPNAQAASYVKSLPPGDRVISQNASGQ